MTRDGEGAIVGRDVADERRLRPVAPARDLDAFLEFLEQIEALVGPPERRPQPTPGSDFRL